MIFKMENDGAVSKNHSDFSIDHILNRAGSTINVVKEEVEVENISTCENQGKSEENSFPWLQCTRFCPPKIPRVSKRELPQKRQLGRYPRIPFTNEQLAILEEKFQESPYLSSEEALNLSKRLQLADVKVKIWFQNRRARKRKEEMGQIKKEKVVLNSETTDSRNMMGEPSTSSDFVPNRTVVPFIYITPQGVLNFSPR